MGTLKNFILHPQKKKFYFPVVLNNKQSQSSSTSLGKLTL